MLHDVSDATIRLVGLWFLIGWGFGVAFALAIWWRPITRDRYFARDRRLLQMQLEDSDRQLTAAIQSADRMARMIADQAGRPGGRAA